jgi:hypothetical protein
MNELNEATMVITAGAPGPNLTIRNSVVNIKISENTDKRNRFPPLVAKELRKLAHRLGTVVIEPPLAR